MSVRTKGEQRLRRRRRVRAKVSGTAERPRVSVFRSNRGLAVQLVDDAGRAFVECELGPESYIGTNPSKTLAGKLVLTTPPSGVLLSAQFVIADADGKERVQPIAGLQLIDGNLKPKVRLTTARGEMIRR